MIKLIATIVCAFIFLMTGMSYAGLLDGLVAHYKFDGNTHDSSVNGNDGTISGGVIFSEGIFNQAACFNGTNGYVEAPYHPDLSLMEWSISAWVYPSIMPVDAILVGREDDSNGRYNYALVLGPDSLKGQYETANSEFDHIVDATGVTIEKWHHVVVTRNIIGEHKIYLDGIYRNEGVWNDTPVQNNENLIIARYVDSYPNSDRFFNGCLDDVRLYDRALSDSEIQELLNPTITVAVDIKPGSCPNPLNVKSKGVLSVSINGSEELDVTTIEPTSVLFEGVPPLRWAIADTSTPFEPYVGKGHCYQDCDALGPDGYDDLILNYNKQEIVAAFGEVYDEDCLVLTLTGNLKEEFGETAIVGEDVIRVLIKGKY